MELDTHLAQQALREALDTKEVQEARERLNHISDRSHVSANMQGSHVIREVFTFNQWKDLDLILFNSSSSHPPCFQKLDVLWRDARWIMDCLQCVRSKQWVGAVPLSLVMGGEPPTCPDGEEDQSSLTARLTWPRHIQSQRQPLAGRTTWFPIIAALTQF